MMDGWSTDWETGRQTGWWMGRETDGYHKHPVIAVLYLSVSLILAEAEKSQEFIKNTVTSNFFIFSQFMHIFQGEWTNPQPTDKGKLAVCQHGTVTTNSWHSLRFTTSVVCLFLLATPRRFILLMVRWMTNWLGWSKIWRRQTPTETSSHG